MTIRDFEKNPVRDFDKQPVTQEERAAFIALACPTLDGWDAEQIKAIVERGVRAQVRRDEAIDLAHTALHHRDDILKRIRMAEDRNQGLPIVVSEDWETRIGKLRYAAEEFRRAVPEAFPPEQGDASRGRGANHG